MSRFITISKGTEFLRIPADHLVFISADGNYSNVVTRDGKSALVSFQLGQVEDLIADQLGDGGGQFIRLGRGLIINIHFLYIGLISLRSSLSCLTVTDATMSCQPPVRY